MLQLSKSYGNMPFGIGASLLGFGTMCPLWLGCPDLELLLLTDIDTDTRSKNGDVRHWSSWIPSSEGKETSLLMLVIWEIWNKHNARVFRNVSLLHTCARISVRPCCGLRRVPPILVLYSRESNPLCPPASARSCKLSNLSF